ncbi:hypothetical protein D9619_005158 [Psilocybe cf. subviscida]|uniref:F-box domain-containing protein n=1 Tax=Psilocybe cf. subviscida TaxID=2480587 RepID=A0A8H5F8X4_9AGAR|nr:hypothetical protein D9619_005158 [Psilocybe cf. subviscida]
MPPSLALELHLQIIQHIDNQADLCALSLCCSDFRDEAQRSLFYEVTPKPLHRQAQFISTMNASPSRFGPWVHTFYTNLKPRVDVQLSDMSAALRAMRNLKHLKILTDQHTSSILPGCTFSLHTLAFVDGLQEAEMQYLFYNFLHTQPSISRLQVPYDGLSRYPLLATEVSTKLCPKLDFLGTSDRRFVGVLLRDNRLITRFEWGAKLSPLPPISTRQLNHLEYLFFGIAASPINFTFTHHLTSLVVLELHIGLRDGNGPSPDLSFLQNIPCLRVLIITVRIPPLAIPEGEREFDLLSVPGRAFELSPTLE